LQTVGQLSDVMWSTRFIGYCRQTVTISKSFIYRSINRIINRYHHFLPIFVTIRYKGINLLLHMKGYSDLKENLFKKAGEKIIRKTIRPRQKPKPYS